MNSISSLGLHLSNRDPAGQSVAHAMIAEAAGLDCVWLSEDLYHRGALTTAAAVAASTSRIPIGLGVLTPQIRHPVAMAMELRTLLDLAGPRVTLGIGAGVPERARPLGLDSSAPLRTVRESVVAAKTLLSGRALDQAGPPHTSTGLSLSDYDAADVPPVYVAAIGPKALRQAGEWMDGVILTMMCARSHAAWAVEQVRRAAAAAGRELPVPVVAYLPMAVDDDPEVARRRMKRRLGEVIARWSKVELLAGLFTRWSELDEETLAAVARSIDAGVPGDRLVSDQIVDDYAVAGDARRCREALEAFASAGITVAALDIGTAPGEVRSAIDALATIQRDRRRPGGQ